MYLDGLSYKEISNRVGLTTETVYKHIILPAISRGEILSRPRKKRKSLLREADGTMTELSRSILNLRKQGSSQRAIGRIFSVSGERVRQQLRSIVDYFGVDFLEQSAVSFTEVVRRIKGLNQVNLRQICQSGEVSYIQNIHTRKKFFTPDDLGRLEEYINRKKQRTCSVCGKAYALPYIPTDRKPARTYCDRKGSCYYIYRQRHIRLNLNQESLKGWRKAVYLRLKDGLDSIDDNEWIGLKEACNISGLTYMQVIHLAKQGIVVTHPSANRTWRGQPVTLYSSTQAEIIRQVRKGYQVF